MRGQNFLFTGFVTSLAIMIYGCSPAPRVTLDTDRITSVQLVREVQLNHIKKTSLHATGSISIESRDFSNSGNFVMNLKHPDSLLVRIRGPFGLNVGTVFISQNDFVFYNGMANEAIVGEPRDDILRAFLQMDVGVNDIMDLFLGSSRALFNERHRPDEYTIDGDQYLLIFRSRDSIRRYWIDPYFKAISRIVYSSAEDRPILEERYDRFVKTDGMTMARSIRVISHRERASFSVSYNRINLNADNLSFSYSIPRNAKVREWNVQ
jgi:hypothetical protein